MAKRMNSTIRKDKKKTVIALRDGYRCMYCGTKKPPFQLEHVIPLSKGGNNSVNNLVLACEPCNKYKGNKLPDQIEDFEFRTKVQQVIKEIRNKPKGRRNW